MTSIFSESTYNNSYTVDNLRGKSIQDLESSFTNVYEKIYMYARRNNVPIQQADMTRINQALINLKDVIGSSRMYETSTNGYTKPFTQNDKKHELCSNTRDGGSVCSMLHTIRQSIESSKQEIAKKSTGSFDILNQTQQITENKKNIISRQAQYTMAIEKNKHRRRLIISVAILNTLLIIFYYLMVKPTNFNLISTAPTGNSSGVRNY